MGLIFFNQVTMKGPMNCYMLYCKLSRDKLKENNPNLNNSELTSLLSKNWRNLSEKEKIYFKTKAINNNMQFKISNPNYKKKPKKVHSQFLHTFRVRPTPKCATKKEVTKSDAPSRTSNCAIENNFHRKLPSFQELVESVNRLQECKKIERVSAPFWNCST